MKNRSIIGSISILTLTNNGEGVLFAYTDNSRIENVTASNNYRGICISSSSNNTLTNNTASNNRDDGIYLQYSSDDNTLQSNTASNNCYNIVLSSSSNNTLWNNTMFAYWSGNNNIYHNFGVSGHVLPDYIQSIDTSNTVNEKPIYYWVDQHTTRCRATLQTT